jgi:hypothetical protein
MPLFDGNGNYLQGILETIQMRLLPNASAPKCVCSQLRLLDDTLRKNVLRGVSVVSQFQLALGSYART